MSIRTLTHLSKVFAQHLEDDRTTEIVVNKPYEIGVLKDDGWHWFDEPSLTFDRLMAIAITAAFNTNTDISFEHPICTAELPTGERMHICIPRVTRKTVSLTIRRPSSWRPTLSKLVASGMFGDDNRIKITEPIGSKLHEMADEDIASRLSLAVRRHENILVSGATGSGKTTLMKALTEEIDPNERVISVEDAHELRLKLRNWVPLFYSKKGTVTAEDVIESTLRMRPDRVLMGEIRDGAAFTYLRSIVQGHPGGITTLHAASANEAFDACRLMIRGHPAGQTMSDSDVHDMLKQQIDIVAHCFHNTEDNTYRVVDLYEKAI